MLLPQICDKLNSQEVQKKTIWNEIYDCYIYFMSEKNNYQKSLVNQNKVYFCTRLERWQSGRLRRS